MLEKKGTSQFGASQHVAAGSMLHSWANAENTNPFMGQAESQLANTLMQQQTLKSQDRVMDGEFSRDGSLMLANPMESNSQISVI